MQDGFHRVRCIRAPAIDPPRAPAPRPLIYRWHCRFPQESEETQSPPRVAFAPGDKNCPRWPKLGHKSFGKLHSDEARLQLVTASAVGSRNNGAATDRGAGARCSRSSISVFRVRRSDRAVRRIQPHIRLGKPMRQIVAIPSLDACGKSSQARAADVLEIARYCPTEYDCGNSSLQRSRTLYLNTRTRA